MPKITAALIALTVALPSLACKITRQHPWNDSLKDSLAKSKWVVVGQAGSMREKEGQIFYKVKTSQIIKGTPPSETFETGPYNKTATGAALEIGPDCTIGMKVDPAESYIFTSETQSRYSIMKLTDKSLADVNRVLNPKPKHSEGRALKDKDATLLGVTLNRTAMEEVKTKFGGGGVIESGGDAGGAWSGLCYSGKDGTCVVFRSDELGGKEQKIITIGIYGNKEQVKLVKNCVESPKINKKLKIAGVALGAPLAQIKKRHGTPEKEEKEFASITAEGTREAKDKIYDVTSRIELGLNHGRVTTIEVSRTETY